MAKHPVVKAENPLVMNLPHCVLEWHCFADNTPSTKLAFGTATFPVGGGHDKHRHPNAEEFIYVVKGKARQGLEGQEFAMLPGDCIHIPQNAVHYTFNEGDGELVIMVGFSDARPDTVNL
ncbi:MAG: cupin domain-containing protein [Candidatus Poribacteria bacterium]|nr:cupin domain-containing protein [Candidatus Poribacteria bacterium]